MRWASAAIQQSSRLVRWPSMRRTIAAGVLLAAAYLVCTAAAAQSDPTPATPQPSLVLPNAPGFASFVPNADPAGQTSTAPPSDNFSSRITVKAPNQIDQSLPEAPRTERHIQPGQPAPQLTPGDKAVMGLRGAFSPFAAAGWITAAGYEQLTNYAPNWGTDRGAFSQRLGTSVVRATTEGLLSNSVMAPLLHEDPRYYRLGRSHNPLTRFAYAITRPLITRTDIGQPFPNLALMGGNLAGSALTNAYYPQQNRSARQTLTTFGGSLCGSALGDTVSEFFGGFLFGHSHSP